MEDYMTTSVLKFGVAFGAAMLGSSFAAWCEDGNQAALLKAISGAKISLEQGMLKLPRGRRCRRRPSTKWKTAS
jgi:hypothetical protein